VGNATANTFLILGGSFVLGMAQANLGNYQAALDSLLSALQLSETTSDRFWRAAAQHAGVGVPGSAQPGSGAAVQRGQPGPGAHGRATPD